MFQYRLAGLTITSDFPLPECDVAGVATGESLEILSGDRLHLPVPHGRNARSEDGQRARLVADGVGAFLIEHGRRIVVWPESGIDDATLSQHLTGQVLALALMQRGVLVLHGAVVAIEGRAVIAMGQSGSGKSTTAAACAARGHRVLSDDLAVLDAAGGSVTVRPLAAVVRMTTPEAILGGRARGWRAGEKITVRVGGQANAPLPVGALVRLEDAVTTSARRLHGAEAALTLLDEAFCRGAFRPAQAARALADCTRIAGVCRVYLVSRPRRLDALDALVRQLEDLSRPDGGIG